jgi:phosphocarrier protein HPr
MSDSCVTLKARLEICNEKGLHARASAKFVKLASGFNAQIWVIKDDTRVDAQSIMGLLMLAAAKGSFIDIEAQGEEAPQALEALSQLVAERFGEDH